MTPNQHIHRLFQRNLELVRAEFTEEDDEAHHRLAMIWTERQYSAIKLNEERKKVAA